MMDDETRTVGLLDAQGKPVASKAECESCGSPADRFRGVFGGQEVCMACGHQRDQKGTPRG